QPPHLLLGATAHRLAVEEAEPAEHAGQVLLAAEEQVGGGVEMIGESQVLVDGLDPETARIARALDRDGTAVEAQVTAVGMVDAGDDLDQRRLAGAVVADDRVHLVRRKLEVALRERDDVAEVLLDPVRLEERLTGGGVWHRCQRPSVAAASVRVKKG